MTGAIIILYNPDLPAVEQALLKLLPQVDEVCLVDNSDTSLAQHFAGREKIAYIPLMHNTGIAFAQNEGIRHFQAKGFSDVLFCDQDSIGTEHLVEQLMSVRQALQQQGHRVAAIGPKPINRKTGRSYYNKPRNVIARFTIPANISRTLAPSHPRTPENTSRTPVPSHPRTPENTSHTPVYHIDQMHSIISSFSLISLSVINEVGLFEEPLFIDAVDNEWGWRAEYYHGLHSYMVNELTFNHMQGMPTRLPMKKSPAFRLYYQYRNFLVLLRRPYVPKFWKWHCAWTYTLKLFFYPLFVSPRLKNLRSILRGIRDGIRNRLSAPENISRTLAPSHPRTPENISRTPENISVLMSVYGKDDPQQFDEAMQSIWSHQTRRPDQIVLIEDGQLPDGLHAVVGRWQKEIGSALEVVVNEQNMGLTYSLNKGLEKTSGTLIARMDSDDRSHPRRFELQERFLQEHPEIDILGGSMQEFDEHHECVNIRHYPTSPEAARAMIHRASPVAHPTVMMRRRIFKMSDGMLRYDERFRISQDIALWFDALCAGYHISNIPETTLFFRRASDVYRRRGRVKAWNEFRIYMRGIYRLYGLFTPKYAYPTMRLLFRLMPQRIVRWGYDSKLRRRIAEQPH